MVRERSKRPEEPTAPAEPPTEPATNPVPAKAAPTPPVNWWKLNTIERAETLGVLLVWVPDLVRWYALPDRVVPPCWYQHDALIQELLALYQYRNQSQFHPKAPPSAAMDFHYYFSIWQQRMRLWTEDTSCNTAKHTDSHIPEWADPRAAEHAQWIVDAEEFVSVLTDQAIERTPGPDGTARYRVTPSGPALPLS